MANYNKSSNMKQKITFLMNKMTNVQQKSLLTVIISFFSITCLLSSSQAASTDIQPANQMPQQQMSNQQTTADMQSIHQSQVPQKLPNINVYINRQEIKKLLGKFYC